MHDMKSHQAIYILERTIKKSSYTLQVLIQVMQPLKQAWLLKQVQPPYPQPLYLQSLSHNHLRKSISMITQSEKASKQSSVPTLIRKIYKKCGGDDGVPPALIKKSMNNVEVVVYCHQNLWTVVVKKAENVVLKESVKESESVKEVIKEVKEWGKDNFFEVKVKEVIKEAKEWGEDNFFEVEANEPLS